MSRIIITEGRLCIDGIAIQTDLFDDPAHITLQLGDAMNYYQFYVTTAAGLGGVEPLRRGQYLMGIIAANGLAGERAQHALDRYVSHYGFQAFMKDMGMTQEEIDEIAEAAILGRGSIPEGEHKP